MKLHLKDDQDVFVMEMNNLEETLQHYSAKDYFTIHVIDEDPNSALIGLEDLS